MAVTKLLKCRETPERSIGSFIKSMINFEAEDNFHLINNESIWLEYISSTKHISSKSVISLRIDNIKQL